MQRFLLHRTIQAVGTVIVVSIVVFLFVQASGDPASLLVPFDYATQESIDLMREKLGLNRPLHIQYFSFMKGFWDGETVKSFRYNQPVLPIVVDGLKWTMVLAGSAIAIGVILSIPLGTIAALNRGSLIDVVVRLVAVFGQSMPSFWVAMLLMLFISVYLKLLPVSGLGVKNAILPIATLSFFQTALLLRLFRSEMLEVIHADYIRTARAKGLSQFVVVYSHAFKNAAIPVVTMAGLQLSSLIQGAVVVEPIFAWPGLGFVMVNSVFLRDFPVVVGGALMAAALVAVVNLAVDILYGFLDPRIRVS
ncbi:MAG: ABC transporter permease [Dehalococcoidia bacterium]|nr:ABC transporter permease [Dehalococcoidia bacterium]